MINVTEKSLKYENEEIFKILSLEIRNRKELLRP